MFLTFYPWLMLAPRVVSLLNSGLFGDFTRTWQDRREHGDEGRSVSDDANRDAPAPGPLRSHSRARRVRRRLRRRHEGQEVPRHCQPGPPGAQEPPPPRSLRVRGQYRRRRRHPDPDASRLPRPGVRQARHHPARTPALRRRPRILAPRRVPGGAVPDHARDGGPRRGASGSGLALGADRRFPDRAKRTSDIADRGFFYLPSLSANTVIYKGMLSADQIETMFPDIVDPLVESALALVHQRFSTNTFPS